MGFTACLGASLALGAAHAAQVDARSAQHRLEPILTAPREPEPGKPPALPLSGAVEVCGVTYRYEEATAPALRDLSFRIEAGEFVAIVGPSGSGKSTLLRLLLGFERPQQGEVFFDGMPLAELDLAAVRAQVGAVLQEDRLWPGTVRSNLAGHAPYPLDAVWQAARITAVDDLIRGLPMGMQTLLDDTKLSAAEKQGLLIAAGLLRRPRLLLLDEATAAFDDGLQERVFGNLKALGLTVVCITHRASTVAHADRVLVLEGGCVVQSGRPAELLGRDGPLARLHGELLERSPVPRPESAASTQAAQPATRTMDFYRRAALERFEGPQELDELVTFSRARPRLLRVRSTDLD
jgi:ABC-type bacteriocin/lantibiotic exporter with double-glycine peptidase domain